MSIFEAIILGIIQGITEFLPVSSSGHLVIFEEFLGLNVQGLKSFDVAVHMATLLAILIYFRSDVWKMILAFLRFLKGKLQKEDKDFWQIVYIIIGTLPAVIVGLTLEDKIDGIFRNVAGVLAAMLFAAFVFILAELVYKKRRLSELNLLKVIVIGLAQAIALIPGISRSGSTIVAGIFQGVKREEAARFSFLLGIPAILGAGILTSLKVGTDEILAIGVWPLIFGFLAATIFGLLSIAFLMRFLKKHSLLVFAIYLLALNLLIRLIW